MNSVEKCIENENNFQAEDHDDHDEQEQEQIEKKPITAITKEQRKTANKKIKKTKTNEKLTEDVKQIIHKEIDEFLLSSDECVAFSTNLKKSERAYIHNYIKRLNLISKSYGKGNKRYITVFKRINKSDKNISTLNLSTKSKDLLKKYFTNINNDNVCIEDYLQILKLNENQIQLQNENINLNSLLVNDDLSLSNSHKTIKIPPKNNCPKRLLEQKHNLPIYQYRKEILQTISKTQVIIIGGDTGSGKTTQIPQYILEESFEKNKPCKIICTQPRRMAAVTISQRVAQERGEKMGNTIGYQIRLERCYTKTTNLIYMTTGCFLRSIMGNKEEAFNGLTHIIIDEIHERDKNTDFILISLRDQLYKYNNKKLKIILMSATMDIQLLSNYFDCCPVITVPGKCYEIKIYYLEEILYCTEYKTKKMSDYLNQKNLMNTLAITTTSFQEHSTLLKNQNQENSKNIIKLMKDTQNYIDNILEQCLMNINRNNDELFSQLIYIIEGENISINVTHSKTNKTPLIVAAQLNNYEYVEKFLKLNANQFIYDTNKMIASDYSKIFPDKRCYNLLKLYAKQQCGTNNENSTESSSNNVVNIDEILMAYHKQFNDDEIDHNLLTTLIKMIHNSNNYGSILIFLPGYSDILLQKDELYKELNPGTYKLFLLHGNMRSEDQQKVLEPCGDIRKIILSTNIGETSITFPDVVFVIDCGKIKMNTYDAINGVGYLKSMWISKACAQQRAGRAGRTRTGICYRMYSRNKYESMDKYLIPEFLRVPLTEICLYAKAINSQISIASYLSNALNPPSNVCIVNSINKLKIIGALNDCENMTLLGKHLVDIPLEVQLGKCLLFSIWMKCLDPILIIVAYHSVKDPFVLPSEKSERDKASSRRKLFSGDSLSDHIGIINLYKQWRKSKHTHNDLQFCSENYLTSLSMDMIHACKNQIFEQIRDKYQINDKILKEINQNSDNLHIVYSCLIAGLYPNICYIDRKKMKIKSRLEKSVSIHPSSTLKPPGYRELKQYIDKFKYDWIIYFEKTRINRSGNIRYNTIISPIVIALFCGNIFINNCKQNDNNKNDHNNGDDKDDDDDDDDDGDDDIDDDDDSEIETTNNKNSLIIDDWIEFNSSTDDRNVIEKLKLKINYLFIEFLQNFKIRNKNTYNELMSVLKELYKNEIFSINSINSYTKCNDQNEIMMNIGYFKT